MTGQLPYRLNLTAHYRRPVTFRSELKYYSTCRQVSGIRTARRSFKLPALTCHRSRTSNKQAVPYNYSVSSATQSVLAQ